MGFKNFQGKRDASQGKDKVQFLVSDYMTKKLSPLNLTIL